MGILLIGAATVCMAGLACQTGRLDHWLAVAIGALVTVGWLFDDHRP